MDKKFINHVANQLKKSANNVDELFDELEKLGLNEYIYEIVKMRLSDMKSRKDGISTIKEWVNILHQDANKLDKIKY